MTGKDYAYIAGGALAVGVIGYIIYKAFGGLSRISAGLDAAAEKTGYQASVYEDATTPGTGGKTLYIQARSDYAASVGKNAALLTAPEWPTEADWINGAGPAGFKYGSYNYPVPSSPSFWGSFWDAV